MLSDSCHIGFGECDGGVHDHEQSEIEVLQLVQAQLKLLCHGRSI